MPVYTHGFSSYKRVHLIEDTNHAIQFVNQIEPTHWNEFLEHAKYLQKNSNHSAVKILPSTYKKILLTQSPSSLVKPLIVEHINHHDKQKEFHRGGGLYEGIHTVVSTAANILGGDTVGRWTNPRVPEKHMGEEEFDMAQLVDQSYGNREDIENYQVIPEYTTNYGVLYRDSHGNYTYAIRGTKAKTKDLWSDAKIMTGKENTMDEELNDSFLKFMEEFPGVKVNVAAHSLGTELALNGADYVNLPVREFYIFNPASSPAMSKEHIRKELDRPNAKFFLSQNDVVSKFYNQNLMPNDYDRIYMSPYFYRSPLSSHKLGQWLPPDE